MALCAQNQSPWGLATLNPQSTCHGPRAGPNLRRGVRAGSLRATEPTAREKTRGRKRKKCRSDKKNTCIHSIRTNRRLKKNDKKRKKHLPQGDDTSTVSAGTCRVGRGEHVEARSAISAPRGGPHLDLGRFRLKPGLNLTFPSLRRQGQHIYTNID